MGKPQMTKKHIPTRPDMWVKELEGIRGFLSRLDGLVVENGQAWVDAQRNYNELREADLLNHPPKGVRVKADGTYKVVAA